MGSSRPSRRENSEIVYIIDVRTMIAVTIGIPIKLAITGMKKPAACKSSLTRSLAEGKAGFLGSLSIIGKMPESLPLTTRSAFVLITKSGLNPIFRICGIKMQLLLRSSATTTQSFFDMFSCDNISFRILSLPSLVIASPLTPPVNFRSFVSTSIPYA